MHPEPKKDDPFHAGEREVQRRSGSPATLDAWARTALRDHLIEQHQLFFAELPFLVITANGPDDRLWVSVLWGAPGFATSADPHHLTVTSTLPDTDPLHGCLTEGSDIGLLGIALHTQRRNRLNGHVKSSTAGEIIIRVAQSFGNCKKYITRRRALLHARVAKAPERSTALSQLAQALISQADTFFIGSGMTHGAEASFRGLDASHRGGEPGFVTVESANRLTFPDYSGNNLFNTLGNLSIDPRAGITFIDFESGSLLQLTGKARLDWDSERIAAFPGARRLIHFDVDQALFRPNALQLAFEDCL